VLVRREKTSEKNLYRVGNAYWYRRGDFERSLGEYPTEKKAIEYKRHFEAKLRGDGLMAHQLRVAPLFEEYLAEREAEMLGKVPGRRQISPGTFKETKDIWELHLFKAFGTKRLAEVNDPLWSRYCDTKDLDLTNHRKVLKHFLTSCKIKGYLQTLPILPIPKVERRVRMILTPDEIGRVLTNSSGTLLLFVSLYLFMGVRWSESIRLKQKSVFLDENFLVIERGTSRTRRGREIPLNAFVAALLRERMTGTAKGSPWVFPKRGAPKEHMSMTGINNPWRVMKRKAGLPDLRPHDLRATFEYYANKRADFTDTQREKFAGASIEVQRRHYVSFKADDVRGLEESVQFAGLDRVLAAKLEAGKTRVIELPVRKLKRASGGNKR